MGAAVVLIALLPWLDRSPVKSVRYRGPICKTMLVLFVISFIGLVILALLFLPALFYGLCFLVLSTGMNGYEFMLGGFIGLVVAACIAYGFVKLLRWRGDDVGED